MAGTEQLMSMVQQQKAEYKLYVGDLDENCNETILKQNFAQFGAVRAVVNKAKRKRYPGESSDRYYGIVYLSSPDELERAKKEMDQQVIMNNRIRVCLYRNYFDRIETDVYLKGVEKLSPAQVKTALDKYGPVFSVKIAQEKSSGASLNYGYLSFTDKEAKDKCLLTLKGQPVDVEGHSVEVLPFTPYAKRSRNQTNIYVKNLPGPNEGFDSDKVKAALLQIASAHGTIISSMVKFDEKFQKHFAFICFSQSEEAKNAYSVLEEFSLGGLKAEVNWAQKKDERQSLTYQNLKSNAKKTNIFIKNLLEESDESRLKEVFEQFGTITSVAVKSPPNRPSHVTTKTNFAFVNFQQEAQAVAALAAKENASEGMKGLFLNGEVQLCLFKPKDQLHKGKKGNLSQQNIMQMMQHMAANPAMFYQTMQQMMMMNMMMLNKNAAGRPSGPFPKGFMMKQPNMNMGMNMQMPNMQMPNMNMGMNMPAPNMQMGMANMMPMQMGMANVPAQPPMNQPRQPAPIPQKGMTAASLKENLSEFLKQDQPKQRSLLGELLFPLVNKIAESTEQAPKITGMLIDFEVFEVSEILEFLENEELLKERVKEAEELIENTNNNPSQ